MRSIDVSCNVMIVKELSSFFKCFSGGGNSGGMCWY